MAWKIDISTDEKKQEVYNLFNSFSCKADIYRYYNVNDGTQNVHYLNSLAEQIGFDFNIYKERKKRYCLECGKELKSDQHKFWSNSCSASYNNKNRKVIKYCLNCGKNFEDNNSCKLCKQIYCNKCCKYR